MNNRKQIQAILDKDNVFAVVGASNNKKKFGYKIYNLLKKRGYTVFPINPNRSTVQGDRSFNTIADLSEKPDVISVITPPEVSEEILAQAMNQGIKTIWFQPGAESENIKQKAQEDNDTHIIYDECLLATLQRQDV